MFTTQQRATTWVEISTTYCETARWWIKICTKRLYFAVAGGVSLVIPCCNDGIADRSQHSGLESSKNRHNLNQSTICLFFDDSSPLCWLLSAIPSLQQGITKETLPATTSISILCFVSICIIVITNILLQPSSLVNRIFIWSIRKPLEILFICWNL